MSARNISPFASVSTHASVRRRRARWHGPSSSRCFNSRLREEATAFRRACHRRWRGFNSRLREEATTARRQHVPRGNGFNSRLREEATRAITCSRSLLKFQLTPP